MVVGGNLLVDCFVFKLLYLIQTNSGFLPELVWKFNSLAYFQAPFFCIVLPLSTQQHFFCSLPPSCAYLAFQILLPLTESLLPRPAIILPVPFHLFSSDFVILVGASLCNLYHTAALCAHRQCVLEYSEGSHFPKHWNIQLKKLYSFCK